MAILTLDVGGSGARYSGVMYRSPTDEIMLDIAAAAEDTERDVAAAAAAATAAAEADEETGGEVEPLGEDASDAGEGPFACGGCSSIVIEVADDALFRPHSLALIERAGGGRGLSSSLARYSSPISLHSRFS